MWMSSVLMKRFRVRLWGFGDVGVLCSDEKVQSEAVEFW